MFDVVHRTTYENLLETHRILVFACAEIIKRPPAEADEPILDPSTSVTNLAPNTAKVNEKLMPLLQSDYPHIRFWTERDWRAFQVACSDSTRLKYSLELKSKGRVEEKKDVLQARI
jgi:hypothetical protein